MKFLLALIISIYSTQVFAQDLDRSKINLSLRDIKSVPMKVDGKDGIWFDAKSAEILLDLVQNRLKLALDIIDAQGSQIGSLNQAIAAYKLSSAQYQELASLNRSMFDTVMEQLPNLTPPEPPWYSSSRATFIYGVVVGGAVVFAASYLAVQTLDNK